MLPFINLTKHICLFSIVLILSSCKQTSFEIIDYYRVYRYAENHTNHSNVLMCKLGGGLDPYIPNVKIIQWNQTHIVVETFSDYYLVDGSKSGLCCMCRNITKGPFNIKEIQSITDSLEFKPIKKIEVYKLMLKE